MCLSFVTKIVGEGDSLIETGTEFRSLAAELT